MINDFRTNCQEWSCPAGRIKNFCRENAREILFNHLRPLRVTVRVTAKSVFGFNWTLRLLVNSIFRRKKIYNKCMQLPLTYASIVRKSSFGGGRFSFFSATVYDVHIYYVCSVASKT